jgi:hypothetical protein
VAAAVVVVVVVVAAGSSSSTAPYGKANRPSGHWTSSTLIVRLGLEPLSTVEFGRPRSVSLVDIFESFTGFKPAQQIEDTACLPCAISLSAVERTFTSLSP